MKFLPSLLSILPALALCACQSAFLTDLITPPGERLFWDDFSAQTGNWPQASGAQGALGYADGAYRLTVQAPGYDLWAVSGHAYRDVQVEADALRLAGPDDNRFGLICRHRDDANFYIFVISSDGYYAIGKVRDGAASLLGQEMMAYSPFIVPGDGPNRLRFDCIGPALTGYVNGQMIAVASDPDFARGDAGLIAGAFETPGVEVAFDNFVVTKP